MKKSNKKINASIIIIGNEILSGRTQDVNVVVLSKWLNDLGVRVSEVRKKFKYVFTTGGIGPTHDDITAETISKAFDLKYGLHKEAFSILEKYYEPGEFNEGRQKMAKMPVTAKLILNPSSGAPGFYVENVFCLPGEPSILKSMLGGLNNVLVGRDPILSKTINLRTYESEIAKSLTNVQNNNKDVEIGSYPFFRQGKLGVSVVIRSANKIKIEKCSLQILEFVKSKNIKIVEID